MKKLLYFYVFIIINVLLLCCPAFSQTVLMHANKLGTTLSDESISDSEKKEYISLCIKKNIVLDANAIESILFFLKSHSFDNNYDISVLDFVFKQAIPPGTLFFQKELVEYLLSKQNEPKFIFIVINSIQNNLSKKWKNSVTANKVSSDLFFNIFDKSDVFFNFCLNDGFGVKGSLFVMLFAGDEEKRVTTLFINKLNINNHKTEDKIRDSLLNLLLKYEENDIIFFFRGQEIEIIAELSHKAKEKEIADNASKILALITGVTDVTDWSEWWNKNKEDFSIEKNALKIIENLSSDDTAKKNALTQILYSCEFYPNNLPYDYYKGILNNINGDKINEQSKKYLLRGLIASRNKSSDMVSDISDTVIKYINNPDNQNYLLPSMETTLVNNNKIRGNLYKIMEDNKLPLLNRGFAAYALRNVKQCKKETALKVLDFMQVSSQSLGETRRPFNLAVISLEQITGEHLGESVSAWKKTVSELPEDIPLKK